MWTCLGQGWFRTIMGDSRIQFNDPGCVDELVLGRLYCPQTVSWAANQPCWLYCPQTVSWAANQPCWLYCPQTLSWAANQPCWLYCPQTVSWAANQPCWLYCPQTVSWAANQPCWLYCPRTVSWAANQPCCPNHQTVPCFYHYVDKSCSIMSGERGQGGSSELDFFFAWSTVWAPDSLRLKNTLAKRNVKHPI